MENQETKVCGKCSRDLPLTMYWLTDKRYGYLRKTCKDCDKESMRLRYAARADVREYSKRKSTEWAKANPEKQRAHNRRAQMKLKYGITEPQYFAMLEQQGGKCALCGSTEAGRNNPHKKWKAGHWNIDHCHATGHVRGLLCHKCNVRVGAYEGLRDEVGFDKLNKYLHLE
jgi:hypothetical protein